MKEKKSLRKQPLYVLVLDGSFKTKNLQIWVISINVLVYGQQTSGPKSVLKSRSHHFFCLAEAVQGHTGGAGWQMGKTSRQTALGGQENRDCPGFVLCSVVRSLLTEAWPCRGG